MEKSKEAIIVCLSLVLVMAAVMAMVGGINMAAASLSDYSKKLEDSAAASADVKTASDKVSWGLGKAKNELGQPVDAVNAQKKYGGDGGVFIAGDKKEIFLTFDCGYENGCTEKILGTLKEKNVKAVFFVTGEYLDDTPQLVAKMIEYGQAVGNHTLRHPSMPTVSEERQRGEIEGLNERLLTDYGYKATLFRFPQGEFSQNSLRLVNTLGLKSVFWSFAYKDWLPNAQPQRDAALKKLTDSLHPGAIYLLHAVSKTNADILAQFIDEARAQGYTFGDLQQHLGTEYADNSEIIGEGIVA